MGAANTTTNGALPFITQNSDAGVTIVSQYGNVANPTIVNNGNGNVVLAAGTAIAAGTSTGGQLTSQNLTSAALNTIQNNGTGTVYLYSGSSASTGLPTVTTGSSAVAMSVQYYSAYGQTINGGGKYQLLYRQLAPPTPAASTALVVSATVVAVNPTVLPVSTLTSTNKTAISGTTPTQTTTTVTFVNPLTGINLPSVSSRTSSLTATAQNGVGTFSLAGLEGAYGGTDCTGGIETGSGKVADSTIMVCYNVGQS